MKKFAFALLLAPVMMACSGGKTIDGTWNVSGIKNMPPGSKMTHTFSNGKDMTMTMNVSQEIPGGKLDITAVIKGTYSIAGDMVTMKADSVTFSQKGAPDAMKEMIEKGMKDQEEVVKKQINDEGKTKLAWVDDKSFTLEGKDGKATYTKAN